MCKNTIIFLTSIQTFCTKVKYVRRKINEGAIEEWKKALFIEIAEMRDMEEHTGGRRKISQ